MKNKYVITAVTVILGLGLMFAISKIFHKDTRDSIKVGFVYNADTATAYTQNFFRARTELESIFGDKVEIFEKFNLGEVDSVCEEAMEYFIEEGCQLIFAISYGHGNICKKKY